MKVWMHHPLLLAMTLYLSIRLTAYGTIPAIVFGFCFFFRRTGWKGAAVTLVLISLAVRPIRKDVELPMREARIVTIGNGYAVAEEKGIRVLLYTDETLILDDLYCIRGKTALVQSVKGFYRFRTENWLKSMKVSAVLEDAQVIPVRSRCSFRNVLQRKIETVSSITEKALLYKALLNVKCTDEESFFFAGGFSFAGILAVMDLLLKYVLDRKRRKRVLLVCNAVLCVLYDFPQILLQSLLFRIFALFDADPHVSAGLGLSVLMLLRPYAVYALSFQIPALFRLCSLIKQDRRAASFTGMMLLQSASFGVMNPVQSLLYPMMQRLLGMIYLLSLLHLVLPFFPFASLCTLFERFSALLERFALPGSVFGAGMIFALLLCLTFRKRKHALRWYCGILLVFQCFGLFHPFASVSFINVGQGDAILLRAPLNTCSILMDTGKPSQWNALKSYLQAEGIRKLDALIVTHGDLDHAGNKDAVCTSFQPSIVLEEHYGEKKIGPFVLEDLNPLACEDENRSSLTAFFQLNNLVYALMGDCDEMAEAAIVHSHPSLSADILKLSHHGSDTGSCRLFLDTLQPMLGVVSSGANNLYHHPSADTVQRLLKRHIPYLDTKEEGDITVICIGRLNLLVCASGKIAIISR